MAALHGDVVELRKILDARNRELAKPIWAARIRAVHIDGTSRPPSR